MNSVHLHHKLVQQLTEIGLPIKKAQRTNLALWCQALAVSPNCHLATLALGLPLSGNRENIIQRLRRSMKSKQLQSQNCYQAMVRHLLNHWRARELPLVMDRTDLHRNWSILTVGVAYRKRLLPLAWQILPFGGTSAPRQIELLKRVKRCLPATTQMRVHYYGDSEFRAVPLQQQCQDFKWHWQVGLKSDTYFQDQTGRWQQLQAIELQPGQTRYLQQVHLTQLHNFGPVNLIVDWRPNQDSPRYWALDLPANAQAWRRGRKRFWTEATYRDWKSYGFDLESSKINDPDRLQVVMLGIAMTTIWMIYIGQWLDQHDLVHLVAPTHKTDYSIFRLGRDYLQRCLLNGWKMPVGFTAAH